ncbi:CBS domain-containing protein, partial [Roseburia inulinivorans]
MDDGGSPTTGMKKLSNRLMKLFGVDTDDVTEEEIISMVNEGHEQGVLQANEAEMIHNIFEFGDKDAKDIMVHRKNIIAIDGTMTFLEMLDFTIENNYSRYPVYIDDIDNIIGVLHIKEVLALCQKQEIYHTAIKDIKGLIREVDFIPETRNINTLFTTMQNAKTHIVIVVDEYGQTSG